MIIKGSGTKKVLDHIEQTSGELKNNLHSAHLDQLVSSIPYFLEVCYFRFFVWISWTVFIATSFHSHEHFIMVPHLIIERIRVYRLVYCTFIVVIILSLRVLFQRGRKSLSRFITSLWEAYLK